MALAATAPPLAASYILGSTAPLYASTSTVSVSNTAAEGTLIGSGVGSLTLPANFFQVGKSLRVIATGLLTAPKASAFLRIRLKIGSVVVGDTSLIAPQLQTIRFWRVVAVITCRTTGASGTVKTQTAFENNSSQTGVEYWGMTNSPDVTIDTTAAHTVDLTAVWSGADPGQSIFGTNFIMGAL